MGTDKDRITFRMMRLCSTGEKCRSEILGKLAGAGLPDADAQQIVDKLCREGYIDEARYSRAFVHDKSSLQGWGIAKIRLALQRKGISSEDIASAIGEMDTEAADRRLTAIMTAKWKSLSSEKDIRKKQARLFRHALARGYGYDQIQRVYDTFRTT